MPRTPQDLMTASEARELLDVAKSTMHRMMRDGRLTVYLDDRDRRFRYVSRAEVERMLAPRPDDRPTHYVNPQ